jgi:hypothetical protein
MSIFGLGMAFAMFFGKREAHKKICIHNFCFGIDTYFLLVELWQNY